MADHELLRGRDESTPLRALNRVALVVLAVVCLFGALAYGLWTALN
ncbi:MAG TPA: hypothetical protein VFL60_01625 [Gaiellaceae bacterium]|nr:hypothetical protein [Gaiellaceae bacterium]